MGNRRLALEIVEVTPLYSPYIGGIASHVKKLSESLVEKGVTVTVVTTDYLGSLPKTEVINGVTVKRFRSIAPNNEYHFCPQIFNHLLKNNFPIVHAQAYHTFVSLFAACAKKNASFVLTPHTWGFTNMFPRSVYLRLYMPFGKIVYAAADKIIAVSQIEERWIQNVFKIPKERTIYLPHPIEIPDETKSNRCGNSTFNIGYIGRLDSWKRVDVLVSAFKILSKHNKKIQLTIAGDGPCLATIREQIGSADNIHLLGRIPHAKVKTLLPQMDVLVLPSEIEVSPVVAYEAMANGVALMTTPVGDLSLLNDGKNCVFIKVDPSDIALKIEELIEDSNLRLAIAREGRRIVQSNYEETKVINRYISLFNNLLN